jgi:hypothetical protein
MGMRIGTWNVRSLYRAGSLRAVVEVFLKYSMRWSDTEVDLNKAWETIIENIKMSAKESLGYYEPKKHKPWFDEG